MIFGLSENDFGIFLAIATIVVSFIVFNIKLGKSPHQKEAEKLAKNP